MSAEQYNKVKKEPSKIIRALIDSYETKNNKRRLANQKS